VGARSRTIPGRAGRPAQAEPDRHRARRRPVQRTDQIRVGEIQADSRRRKETAQLPRVRRMGRIPLQRNEKKRKTKKITQNERQ